MHAEREGKEISQDDKLHIIHKYNTIKTLVVAGAEAKMRRPESKTDRDETGNR